MKFDPKIHHRRSIRIPGYDYSQPGAYFITIVAYGRECLFGEIQNGIMRLSDIGQIADENWHVIPEHFPQVELSAFVVMPNHVHGIVVIREHGFDETLQGDETLQIVETLQATSLQDHKMAAISPKAGSLSVVIRSYKSAVTKLAGLDGCQEFAWQSRFYDQIIRDEKSFNKIRYYFFDNPVKWELDQDNPSNLTM